MTEPDTRVPLPLLTVRPVALPEPVLRARIHTPRPQLTVPALQLASSTARPGPVHTAPVLPSCSVLHHRLAQGGAHAKQGDVSCSCASASLEKPIMDSLDAPDVIWSWAELHAARSTPPSARRDLALPDGRTKAGQA